MKKTILGLVASTFIAGVAHAAPAPVTFTGHATTGAECSAQFDDIGGINVKELSERKQCLAVVHDIDTMFTYKTFWVRTGTTFTAFDVEKLGRMNRSERIEVIKNGVTKEAVKAALEAQREELEEAHMAAIVELSKVHASQIQAAAAEVARLQSELVEVGTIINELAMASSVHVDINEIETPTQLVEGIYQAGVDSVDVIETVSDLFTAEVGEYELTSINNSLNALVDSYGYSDLAGLFSDELGIDFTGDAITTDTSVSDLFAAAAIIAANHDSLQADLQEQIDRNTIMYTLVHNFSNHIVVYYKNGRQEYIDAQEIFNRGRDSVDIEQILADARLRADDNGYNGGAATAANLRESEDYAGFYEIDITRDGQTSVALLPRSFEYGGEVSSDQITDADSVADIEVNGTAYFIDSLFVDNQEIVVGFNFFNLDLLVEVVADKSFAIGFERGFSKGYDKGFNDGYEQGYKAGFADGFDAGVDSVR